MNGEEFGYLNMLNLKNKMERPNYSDFLQNWFPQKLGHPSIICRNLKTLRKFLLRQTECTETE